MENYSVSITTELIALANTENSHRVADIIFVHGLGGDAISTWYHPNNKKEKDNFWGMWLGKDFPQWGIWSLDYEVSSINLMGSDIPLVELADSIAGLLVDAYELGERPLIFITHSMGGLVVKQMLRNAQDYGDSFWKRMVEQTKGIVYIATPHSGAGVASLMKFLGIITSVNLKELEANHPRLLELNRVHRSNEKLEQIPIKVFGENLKTNGFMVVDRTTLDPGRKEVTPIILPEENHISISKPESKNSRIYREVRTFIKRCLPNSQPLPDLKVQETISPAEELTSDEIHSNSEQLQIGRDNSTNIQTRVTGVKAIIGENINIYPEPG